MEVPGDVGGDNPTIILGSRCRRADCWSTPEPQDLTIPDRQRPGGHQQIAEVIDRVRRRQGVEGVMAQRRLTGRECSQCQRRSSF